MARDTTKDITLTASDIDNDTLNYSVANISINVMPLPPTSLNIVEVSAPNINCIFDRDCTITVSDIASNFTPPSATGNAFLQSRTWPVGEAGTPGAGLYAYLYRIDLRNTTGVGATICVTKMNIDFGAITHLNYNDDSRTDDHIFVITQGGLGNVRPSSAEHANNIVSFQFAPPICVGTSSNEGDSSFFF